MSAPVKGLLVSQIGYDLSGPKRALIRGSEGMLPRHGATYSLTEYRPEYNPKTKRWRGPVTYWGQLWGSHWWVADLSHIEYASSQSLVIYPSEERGGKCVFESYIETDADLLWDETWFLCAIDQAERRQKLARDKVGWYDAGTAWQEASSHAAYIVGMCDLLEFVPGKVGEHRARLEAQILNGCDYLARLQDRAGQVEGGVGAVVHQIWKYDTLILPGDVSKAAMAWARAARTLSDAHVEKRGEYTDRAEQALHWLKTAKPLGAKGFNRTNHAIPADAPIPDEWMTRDLLMHCWAAFELAMAGRTEFAAEAARLAEKVMARQVRKGEGEGGLFGHFRTFDSAPFTEMAWIHNGDGGYGADCGGHFPHWVLPLLKMREAWPTHPDAPRWEQCIRDFAYGYLLPACRANPFFLLPQGVVPGEGLVWFAGLWHGMNAAYALAATLALEFERFFGDAAFREVAVGNLQWIAGLNAGLTAESLFASHMYSTDVPEGEARPVSMICGVGRRTAGSWMQIRGSICNGFSTGDQFRFDVDATKANDGPHAFTDEDWISHSGGWLSALSRL